MKTKTIQKKTKTSTLYRSLHLDDFEELDEEKRTFEFSFSSEAPVERFIMGEMGDEVLDHDPKSVRMEFMGSGNAPFLMDHDMGNQVGVIESATIDGSARRGTAIVRLGKSDRAEELLQDIKGGIRKNISFGYRVHKFVQEEEGDKTVFRASDWEPFEISSVSVPADTSIGIGRADGEEIETIIEYKEAVMPEEVKDEGQDTGQTRATVTETVPAEPKVDVKKVAGDAVTQERTRSKEITALGAQFNLRELADKAIADGASLDQFRTIVLTETKPQAELQDKSGNVDMSEKQEKEYSLFKAVQAVDTGDWSKAGFEREISDQIAQQVGHNARSFFLPKNLNWTGKRDITVAGDGELVGTDHRGDLFIDALRDQLVVARAGARILTGLVGDVSIPAQNAVTNVFWVAENTAPTEGAPTYRNVTLSPKTIAAFVDISRKLMLQSNPSIEAIIREDLFNGIVRDLDQKSLQGGGTNEPTGILTTSGIGDVAIASDGGAVTWDTVVDLQGDVDSGNALEGSLNYVGSALVRAALMKKPRVSGTDSRFIMDQSNELIGHPFLGTNLMPDDLTKGAGTALSALIFGNFNDLLIGHWGALDIMVDRNSLSTVGGLRITAFQDIDVAVRHAESFSASQDIDTTA